MACAKLRRREIALMNGVEEECDQVRREMTEIVEMPSAR